MTKMQKLTPWREEADRLLAARSRYLSSLDAIQEIADFAAENESSLESKAKYTLTVTSRKEEGIDVTVSRTAAVAFGDFFKSILEEAREFSDSKSETIPQESKPLKEESPHTEFLEALESRFKEFEKRVPGGMDGAAIEVHLDPPRRRTDVLLASLLTAAVSDFEVLFASLVKFFYRVRPDALRSQDVQIPWLEVEQYSSIEELKNRYIDERVNKLMWQGVDEWMKWVGQQLKIKFEEAALDPEHTREIFQRRHVIIHSGGLTSRQYLSKVSNELFTKELNEELKVDLPYLSATIRRLSVLGISLVHLTMRKLCQGTGNHESIDQDILDVTFDLLVERNWEAAEQVASTSLPQIHFDYQRHAMQVNKWIAIKRRLGKDAIEEEVSQWDVSALQPIFEVARLALLEDSSAADKTRQLLTNESLDEKSVATWPIFENIRNEITPETDEPADIPPAADPSNKGTSPPQGDGRALVY